MDMERVIQEAYDNGYLRGYEKGKADRPRGEWIFHSEWEEYYCRYECSLCGRTYDYDMNYCGFCGARMKGADHEDN